VSEVRTKPTKQQKRYKRSASLKDYGKMVVAATEVVVKNRGRQYKSEEVEYLLMEFPFWVKFQTGFPKGVIVEKTKLTNVYKVNGVKLLNWLHEQGYSSYNADMLVKNTKQFEYLEKSIERMFN
jgi:hypothetical protein